MFLRGGYVMFSAAKIQADKISFKQYPLITQKSISDDINHILDVSILL